MSTISEESKTSDAGNVIPVPVVDTESLGDVIKGYEEKWETILDQEKPYVVRLDGHGFSKFTKGFKRPVDERITYAMIRTAEDLLCEFNPVLVYTQSDEISLLYPAPDKSRGQTMNFGGRTQKICSLAASYASIRFNHHLSDAIKSDDKEPGSGEILDAKATGKKDEKVSLAYFDGRVFSCPNQEMAMMSIFWRHSCDAYRNAVSNLAMCHFSHKQLFKKNTVEKLRMLAEKKVYLEDYPSSMYYGSFIKREQYDRTSMHYDTVLKKPVPVKRTRPCAKSFKWQGTKEERTELAFRKYWS